MLRANLKKLFSTVDANPVDCEGCPYLKSFIEEFEIQGHVERERDYMCQGDYVSCQQVDELELEINEFMQCKQDIMQYIEEVE